MSKTSRKRCEDCVHFRSAPWEAVHTGCYLEKNMTVRQKDAFLAEQQTPGNHEKINLRGDCPDHEAKEPKPSLWRRLMAS
jgi:hypothetical protein